VRFETRYRDPKKFAFRLLDEVILSRGFGYNDKSMKEMIIAFGAFMMFTFIEVYMPIVDKKVSIRDRRDRMKY